MFCYGEKESWYKKICPNGMLPALELDGKLYTESDRIIGVLEGAFGALQAGLVTNTISFLYPIVNYRPSRQRPGSAEIF